MLVEAFEGDPKKVEIDSAVLFLYEGDTRALSKLGRGISSKVKKALELQGFKGKEGERAKIPLPGQRIPLIYLFGAGKREKADQDLLRRLTALAVKELKKDRVKSSLIIAPPFKGNPSQALAEGAVLGNYTFDKYKKEKEEEPFEPERILISGGDPELIKRGLILGECQNYARSLVNEPGNVINPETLAREAKELAKEFGLECKIYDEKQIQKMGMLALWSVGKGSATPPRFIHLIYKPKRGKPADKIAIVGKGLTFDSGGLNIKPGDYMRTMKMDKSGACAVLGIMRALALLKPKVEVHGIIGAAENMPSGTAYRPDDIIRAKNGKFIEIDNTDAEGRVTLADALSYASELKPSKIIDMATLTGACMVALGEFTAGLFSNSRELAQKLLEISKRTGERMWELPLDDVRLRKKIKKGPADVVNTGGRYGGAITAAMFLEEFVEEGIEWAHLDIAGPAWSREDYGYYVQGGTGFGVRTLVELILEYESVNSR
jgi:leucyl aminopeptidase